MRKGFYAFAVCILISTAMWFMIRLTGEYKETVIYPVVYKHPFINKIIINQPDKYLSVTYNVKGFELSFNAFLNQKKTLVINITKLKLIKDANEFKAEINTSRFTKQISEQLNIPQESLTINPDSVSLYFIDIFHKVVPVKLNLSLNYEKQYELYKPFNFAPDSITVSGTKRDIDKINHIETEFKSLRNLNKSVYLTLKAVKPKSADRVEISSDKVMCFIPVQKFTEETVDIPVTVINNVKQKYFRIYPDKVQITYLVALNDYKKVNSSMFTAVVDNMEEKTNENNKIKVRILNKPDYIKITKVKPDKVEFIIW